MAAPADPKMLIDAAFAAGADGVSFFVTGDRARGREYSAHVTATRMQYLDGCYRSQHESAIGYGATWLDALVDAMLKLAKHSPPRDVAGEQPGQRKPIGEAKPTDNMGWRERRRLEARRGRG